MAEVMIPHFQDSVIKDTAFVLVSLSFMTGTGVSCINQPSGEAHRPTNWDFPPSRKQIKQLPSSKPVFRDSAPTSSLLSTLKRDPEPGPSKSAVPKFLNVSVMKYILVLGC